MELNRFRIFYRDSSYNTIDKISCVLKPFGVIIKCVCDGDSYYEYQINKIDGDIENIIGLQLLTMITIHIQKKVMMC